MSVQPAPPPSVSDKYTSLHTTALAFVSAHSLDPTHAWRIDFDLLESLCAPDFAHSWGHNYAVSQSPRLQGILSFGTYKTHLQTMIPALDSFDATITDVMVDELKRKVVLRLSFLMKVKGGEGIENDMVWVLGMDGDGRVVRSTEFVDGVAAGKLKELMMGAKT